MAGDAAGQRFIILINLGTLEPWNCGTEAKKASTDDFDRIKKFNAQFNWMGWKVSSELLVPNRF